MEVRVTRFGTGMEPEILARKNVKKFTKSDAQGGMVLVGTEKKLTRN